MLRQTKPWTRFVGVVLLIVAGLMVVGGLLATVSITFAGRRGVGPSGFLMLFYVALGCVYGGAGLFLNRYASRIADLLQTRRSSDLEAALEAQKSFWRFVGILALIAIGLWVVFMLIMLIGLIGVAATRR
jgi:hypothetical protein